MIDPQGLYQVQGRAGLRPDERAAGGASARRPHRPDRGRVLPRRRGPDMLLFIDNIFRFTQAGSEVSALLGRMPSRRGLSAHPRHRNGRAAGTHHLHQEGFHHLGAGRLRARRRLHRPRAGHDLRAPGRHHRTLAPSVGTGHLSGRRSAGFHLAHSRLRASSARSTTTSPSASSRFCSATRTCRTSSPFSASTSSRTTTRSPSPAPARSSASCRSPSTSPNSSPASRANTLRSTTRFAASRKWSKASTTISPSRPSICRAISKTLSLLLKR